MFEYPGSLVPASFGFSFVLNRQFYFLCERVLHICEVSSSGRAGSDHGRTTAVRPL